MLNLLLFYLEIFIQQLLVDQFSYKDVHVTFVVIQGFIVVINIYLFR